MAQPLSIADLEKMFHRIRELKPDWKIGYVDPGRRTLSVEGLTGSAFYIAVRRDTSGTTEYLHLHVLDQKDEATVCDQRFSKDCPFLEPHRTRWFPDEDRYNLLDSFLEEMHKEAEKLFQARLEAQTRKGETAKQRFFSS